MLLIIRRSSDSTASRALSSNWLRDWRFTEPADGAVRYRHFLPLVFLDQQWYRPPTHLLKDFRNKSPPDVAIQGDAKNCLAS